MPTYVAFLRAINLGATRKFPMAELRACLGADGFEDVETYIQTGNVRLSCRQRSGEAVAGRLERLFAADRGFGVPTVVLTPAELAQVYADALALRVDAPRRYVTLLRRAPGNAELRAADPGVAAAVGLVDGWDRPGEGARVVGRAVHWWLEQPMQASRLSNTVLERHLGPATTRDLKVIRTLAERWAPAGG